MSTTNPEPAVQCAHSYLRKVDGVWTCSCGGVQRDKNGKPPKVRHLQLVR